MCRLDDDVRTKIIVRRDEYDDDDDDDVPSSTTIPFLATISILSLYVLSGCTQPLMMTLLRHAGVADSNCQLYMLFYYIGPASAIVFTTNASSTHCSLSSASASSFSSPSSWPSWRTIFKASGIALFDIVAQVMNYTGASLAGPTIFAIVYSSVTIWAALYSQLFLGRSMDRYQWIGVIGVFAGLALTSFDGFSSSSDDDEDNNSNHNDEVSHGLLLVTAGSSMHGLFYVMSESVMMKVKTTTTTTAVIKKKKEEGERLTVSQNCAVQGITASFFFLLWQILYTIPNFDEKIMDPMIEAGTTPVRGFILLIVFGMVSFVHSITFYHALRYLPGGSTSAGVVKGLQAVLVFVLTDYVYCGRFGGAEMCFNRTKFVSLIAVTFGVTWYGFATTRKTNKGNLSKIKQQEQRLSYNNRNYSTMKGCERIIAAEVTRATESMEIENSI